MKMKRATCMVLCCVLLIGSILIPARAAERDDTISISWENSAIVPRAIGSFNMTIPAYTRSVADSSFRLEAGETVTIRAYYTPTSASVDFGVVASDGTFYYFNSTDGNMNKTMQISESGYYTLQIRNNSGSPVQVSGFVNY